MRLLELLPNGDIRLARHLKHDANPPYAILSHTWGEESEEVTFEEMDKGSGRHKAGYEKIKFCGEQAARDGLQYFWVDSCCIKKSSDAELSKSLNSMFRWYQRAAKCYVYLSDVSIKKRKRYKNSRNGWEPAFRESRWFTRGWTLPELLAPLSIGFFSKEGDRLGDKESLRQLVSEITGIPIPALQGSTLSQYSTEEKFDWAKNRITTLEEDWVYSLLGVFGISMPVVYGEGSMNAVRRLKREIEDASNAKACLRDLYVTDPRADKARIEKTKGGLLVDSYHWVLENGNYQTWLNDDQSSLLWIKGDPGKGKSMLLCGIIDELTRSTNKTPLLSFFFCQASDSRINSATAVLRGLLYLLVDQQPLLISHIQKYHDHAGKSLFEDANAWTNLSDMFINVLQDPSLRSTYLIIDALDECLVDLPKLLDLIIQQSSAFPHIKWLVSSRNWPEIEERLDDAERQLKLRLELNAESVSAAVDCYIHHTVHQLAQEKKYDDQTRDAVLHHMSLNANSTFLWVAVACQNLRNVKRWNVLDSLKHFPPGLNSLYSRMMKQIHSSGDADRCRQILAVTATVYRPVTLKEVSCLVDVPKNITQKSSSLVEIIGLCGSFLTVREDVVYLVHQSAQDYLLTDASGLYSSGTGETHYGIFLKSLHIMLETLRRDIYELRDPGYLIEQVKTPKPDPLAASSYSCIYWVDHLCDWSPNSHPDHEFDLQNGNILDFFLKTKYLYWVEALSLKRNLPKGVVAMKKLEAFVRVRDSIQGYVVSAEIA
ncbi:MAG: hypothetical protein M1821_008033 [Bathelium mastoideum]|nr:MAG: hypothetical protein M1821_008033 [Bathelium mastoideum]